MRRSLLVLFTFVASLILTPVLASEPHTRSAQRSWAQCRSSFDAGDLEQAKTHCERAVQQDPQLAGAWSSLGRIIAKADPKQAKLNVFRDYAAAEGRARRVLAIDPSNAMAKNQLRRVGREQALR